MPTCRTCNGVGSIERFSPYCTICSKKIPRLPPFLVDRHNKKHYFCDKCFDGYEGSKVSKYTIYSALRILRKIIGKNKNSKHKEVFFEENEH